MLLYSDTYDERLNITWELFDRLRHAILTKERKFCHGFVIFLAHALIQVRPITAKISAIIQFQDVMVKKLMRLNEMARYFRKFCPNFSQ